MENNYLFIDGACLRETLKGYSESYFEGNEIKFDFSRLSREYKKVFYYDSPPAKKYEETEEQYADRIKPVEEFFIKLNLLDGYHVYEGISRKRRRGIEQKKVDIMIAVDMLNHAFRKNMSQATLLTSDLDFKPLIDALVDNGMYINLWYPVNNTNKELIQAADSSRKFDLPTIYEYTLQEFKRSNSIPKGRDKIGKDIYNVTKLEDIENRYGIKGELFKANDKPLFYLLFPTYFNPNANTHLEFNDKEKLVCYFKEYSYPKM